MLKKMGMVFATWILMMILLAGMPGTGACMKSSDSFVDIVGQGSQKIKAVVAMPEEKGPFPAIILAYGTGGFEPGYINIAKRFAAAGYVAMVLDYDSSKQGVSGGKALKEIQTAIDVLAAQPEVLPGKIALWGFSNGGAAVLNMAGLNGKLSGVVAVVPYLPNASGTDKKVQVPVLLIGGEYDEVTPISSVRQYEKSLRDQKKPVDVLYGPWGHVFDINAMAKAALEFYQKQFVK